MLNITPRDYQKDIFNTTKTNNTLVVLPTGIGKTLIALMLAVHRIKRYPLSKIIFLAPTRPLVEQHLQTFKSNLPELFATIEIFTGSIPANKRKKIFQSADIIFSTPQCIANDLKKQLYSLENVSLLVIDEAHRCLKNYDYTKVVNSYKQQTEFERILGLTASPGSETKKVQEICNHLNITKIESRTRESKDVKPYLQKREFEKIEVDFPKEFIEIRTLLRQIWDKIILNLKSKNILYGPANKISLLKLQSRLSKQISSGNYSAMHAISQTAQAIKISHALELLETQTLSGLEEYFNNLINQAKAKQSRAVQRLVKSPEFNAAKISLSYLLTKKIQHPKLTKLKEIIEQEFNQNPNSKIIVFSQFRETASKISSVLNKIKKVNSKVFIGQSKKSNTKGIQSGLSQKEQKQIIQDFRDNRVNIICATSIGEEGLDIPEVNAVIFYEPIPSAIRKIQRAGRTARLIPGKLLILITKDTKDEIHHYASSAKERKMHKTLETIKEQLKKKTENPTLNKF